MKTKLITLVLIIVPVLLYSDDMRFSVSGKIHFRQSKPIHVFLVDEETSKTPFKGIAKLILNPNSQDNENGYVNFFFHNIQKGKYGIRCFQDLNGNGKLDKGFFGPSEPWGLSWNRKTSTWPSFEDFNFNLNINVANIDIKLTN